MYNDAEYARGILHNVYSLIPGYYDNSEYPKTSRAESREKELSCEKAEMLARLLISPYLSLIHI